MLFSLPRPPPVTPIQHHHRALTLVFGSDGQVSLIGGIPSESLGVPTFTASAPTTGTHSLPTGPVSSIPNLEATSTFSISASSYDSTAADTDTNLPSVPTVDYPTPTPTAASDPKDRTSTPFYLAMVLSAISLVGCIAALVTWFIRSRARGRPLEFDDPWPHHDTTSDADGSADNTNELEKGTQKRVEAQTRPYHLPASIVRRSSPNLTVPHAILSENGTPLNVSSTTAPDTGNLRRTNGSQAQSTSSGPDSNQEGEATDCHSRPGTERLQTGLSVQESTRTLGRLRVANRVPGDVTSGDEGGMNISRSRNSVRVENYENDRAEVGKATQTNRFVEGDALSEPPGPATLSWGRRMDTVAALRRTRRRTPETTVQTYKNPRYGGYWYPTLDGEPSRTPSRIPVVTNQEKDDGLPVKPPLDPLGWTSTLKSSFWQAVDSMTGNRLDTESRPANAGSSGFTPAPQRVASRRSPVLPTHSTASLALADTRTTRLPETQLESESTLPDESVVTQDAPQNMARGFLAKNYGSDTFQTRIDGIDSIPPRVSHLNRDLGKDTHGRHTNSSRTGSVSSTGSAAARVDPRKYGYADSIPSSWSALGTSRTFSPLPRLILSSSPGTSSTTQSKPTLESDIPSGQSGSASTHTRTTTRSESDMIGSDTGTLWSRTSVKTANYEDITARSVSRGGTIRSDLSTTAHGMISSQPTMTTSGALNRKKGVTARRKRPRLPPRVSSSTASSVQSESGLSIREVTVRKALLERRKKVRAAESVRDNCDDSLTHSHDTGTPSTVM